MPQPSRRDLHPLLLDPQYWRSRLQEQRLVRHFLLRVPRPDLSSASCQVEEIRFRAHDGVRLWGLIGRCPLFPNAQPAHLRTVGACERPSIDQAVVEAGCSEIVLQFPAGRRLEDRVLDVLRACEMTRDLEAIDFQRVELSPPPNGMLADELLIASELRSCGMLA